MSALADNIRLQCHRHGWSYQRLADEMTAAGRPTSKQKVYRWIRETKNQEPAAGDVVTLADLFSESILALFNPLDAAALAELQAAYTTKKVVAIIVTTLGERRAIAFSSANKAEAWMSRKPALAKTLLEIVPIMYSEAVAA